MRTVLFGLDGATFTILDPLIAEGIMPNLAKFCEDGARAKLRSTPMPITPQAWTSMATGRGMGHHGVSDFVRVQIKDDQVFATYNTSLDVHCETIWQYASRNQRRVTALNYICLAPPIPINGHSMPGFTPARHMRRSSFPANLVKQLENADGVDIKILGLDFEVEKQVLSQMPEDQWLPWLDHHIAREQAWFSAMEYLMLNDPSDLTAIVFDGVDKIQHLAYRLLDPYFAPKTPTPWESQIIQRCKDYFIQIDRFLARTREIIGDYGRIFIASDHGFTASTEIVYINRFLHDAGWLTWKDKAAEDDKEAIYTDRLQDHIALMDIPNTKAFALTPSCNGVFINVPDDEYADFRKELTAKLFELKGPDGGAVVTDIRTRESAFPGPYMHYAPDLTLTLRDFGLVSVLNGPDVIIPRSEPWGTHHPDGILIASGIGIKKGIELETCDILDVAPLLVHSIGLPIPPDYDGEFRSSFYESSYLDSDKPRIAERSEDTASQSTTDVHEAPNMDEDDEAIVLQRLKSLGYIE